ncbi:SMI1/KNR4 family protein [Streptomyces sp. NBC_00249]|uniref:SMI1/KNR4 family protein n=1 Tax=Streptomyces sp. NBC_00249 TaxID=2975690 RepID=UPI002253D9FD|nr:SMI1/KNR4 family protein [Streptomyces sp. NBC_00249]MCX5195048.1 SMI1/KNR4 family protein [Streptomyces sp. NBC_00249]
MNDTEQLLEQVADRVRTSARRSGGTLPTPLGSTDITRAALILGFPLPPLLAALYTRVGDGGFGPERGLLPLRRAVEAYEAQRASGWRWPEGVLPVADFGCALYACVDCRSDTAQVLLFDPNSGEPELAWSIDTPSLEGWLRGWLDGTAWFCEESAAGEEYDLELAPLARVQIPDLIRPRTP